MQAFLRSWLRGRGGGFLAGVVVATALAVPLTAYAGHQFSDVPDTHAFHKEISAVAGAGITTGFADGTFRPGNTVTRQAMAAFFERGASRIDYGEGNAVLGAGDSAAIGRATIDAGAAQAGNGLVRLLGNAFATVASSGSASACPCLVRLQLLNPLNVIVATRFIQVQASDGGSYTAGAVQAVVPIAADRIETYRLIANLQDTDQTGLYVEGQLTATYEPFAGDGDGTLARQFSCPADDGYEQNDGLLMQTIVYVDKPESFPAIACSADHDWYGTARDIHAGDRLDITVAFAHAEGNINVCLHRGTTQLGCASTTTDNETINYIVPAGSPSNEYSVQIFLVSDSGAVPGNPYTLTMAHTPGSGVAGDTVPGAAQAPASEEVG